MKIRQLGPRILVAGVAACLGLATATAQDINKFENGAHVRASVFSGNESRIGILANVNSRCQSEDLPDVKVARKPAKGELRLDTTPVVIGVTRASAYWRCNGKEVEMVGVFYKANEGFVGDDRIVVDVDYKIGQVRRVTYVVKVR